MKKPELVPGAKRIALRSWTLWLNRLALLAVLLPEVFFWITGIDYNPYRVMQLWLVLTIGVEVSRYLKQKSLDDVV